ncbi:hypothetical protein [Paenibacillus brevis]|uniref:Uncharacterized protein n=1 Tax=Paenibacillus brevis TaxID=2841508 RepID=A0ABS6FU11_9BACL|nr:hypothetical protein [Paenibacillus brevis]MBU5672631.1 hypothetical protein [Paenibacillus brevis]
METERVQVLMFYDKDNQLVGSVGIEDKAYDNAELSRIVYGAIMDVFSVEEAKKIAYYKLEHQYLMFNIALLNEIEEVNDMHQPKSNNPIGPPPQGGSSVNNKRTPASYAANLRETGLFEVREKVTLKLKVIEKLVETMREGLQVHDEVNAVIRSLLTDLDLYASPDAQNGTVERERIEDE